MDDIHLYILVLLGVIILLLLRKPIENFVLTATIPANTTITAPPLTTSQAVPTTPPGTSIGATVDDPKSYYIKGTLNAVGQKAVADANAKTVNSGISCSLPSTAYIKLPSTDATCDMTTGAYTYQADSAAVCTVTDPVTGKKMKTGTLNPEQTITKTAAYNGGKTCTQQLPATRDILCGTIDPICPVNDNSFYTFSTAATLGGV